MPDLDLFRPALDPPYLTQSFPGTGGLIKTEPQDFEVEEIPAYLPCGQGEFLYLWIEKRGMGAAYFQRQVAQRLGLAASDVGSAGLKDRHAITRQWISVPALAASRLPQLEGEGLRVLQVSRHTNKLRPGHLHGNRFRILIRAASASAELDQALDRLRREGLPNFYGRQRFGNDAETLATGLALLHGERTRVSPFLRKLALSAVQSALFNLYLAERMRDGLLRTVLPGDVMAKTPRGGMFVVTDIAAEQARFERQEIVTAGPIFGVKTYAAAGEARQREDKLLERVGLSERSFAPFKKLMLGTRRHNLVYLDDLTAQAEADGLRLSFSLPAGSYATVLLREVMK
jgi:tRNA pseudouridine13 synthase